jgi:signal peptidase I
VPTFQNGQYLIVDQLTYDFEDPQRGDVIIFRFPGDPSKFFIKRVIGLPGETVTIDDKTVRVSSPQDPQGVTLLEPYRVDTADEGHLTKTLGAGEYFVMGDNRPESSDSRAWGSVPRNLIIGRAFLRLFPVANASVLPGAFHSYE